MRRKVLMARIKTKRIRDKSLKHQQRHHVALPTGQYKIIGCRDMMVGFSKKGGVLVRLYYPASDQDKNIQDYHLLWPNWVPHENYQKGYGEVIGIRCQPLLRMVKRFCSNDAHIPVILNAKPLKSDKQFPVIVFSHGLGACRTTYSSICIELASHGFVVAAVEHRDNSACLTFYAKQVRMSMKDSNPNFFAEVDKVDGDDEADFGDEIDDPNYEPPKALSALTPIPHIAMEWVRHRYMPFNRTGKKIHAFRNRQVHQRVRECSRALDLLEALHAGYELNNILDPLFDISEFEGLLNLDKAIVMGHSFGGATAILSAGMELRFKVAVCLDPWMYPIKEESFDIVTQPILFINSKKSQTEPNLNKIKELLIPQSSDDLPEDLRKAVNIKGAVHFDFCDFPFVFNWLGKIFLKNNHERSKANPFVIHDITMALTLTFIAKHLDIEVDEELEKYLSDQKKKILPTFKISNK